MARHVLPPAAHAGQRPPGHRPDGGGVRRRARSRPVDGSPRLRGLALPELAELRAAAHAAVQRHPGAPQRLRQRRAGARQPAGRPRHRDRRDPALAHERQHRGVRRALQPRRPGHRPLRLDDLGRHRPDHPTRHRDPARLGDDLRQQRPGLPRPPTAPPSSSATATPATSRPPRRSPCPGPTARSPTRSPTAAPAGRSPTSGQSLELADLAADNNVGANWALSTGSGTPGTTQGPAVTAPGGPTIGTATPGNASATVRWTAPSDNGGSAITGYSVRVLNNAEQQVGALRPAGAGATSLVVTGLTNGTAYHFQVAATNSAGTGAFSGSSNTVTPTAGATVPGPPVIGTPSQGAVGGALTAIARWTPPTSTGGSAITGYVSPHCG